MIVSNYSIYGKNGIDVDAQAYINASGNSAFTNEINAFLKALKSEDVYNDIYAIYPFLGTSQIQHKWNAKNPLDTDSAFRLSFNGGGIYTNNGYQTNGINTFANTHLKPNLVQELNSNGLTVTVGTNNATLKSDAIEIGAHTESKKSSLLCAKNNNSNYNRICRLNERTITISGVDEARGIWTGVKQASNLSKFYRNKTLLGSSTGGGELTDLDIYIGNINSLSGTNVGAYVSGFSNQRIQTTMIHKGLSDAKVTFLQQIIDDFENALGRKTW